MANLTTLQRKFINEYLLCGNATEAASRAGYKGDRETLAVTGHRTLRNAKVSAEIEARMKEHAMSANEVLFRLTQHGRSDLRDFMDLSVGELKEHPSAQVIKKLKHKKRTIIPKQKDADPIVEETIEIELYDAQSALEKLGRYHELFVNRTKVEDWRMEAIQAIKNDEIDYEDLAEMFDDDLAQELFAFAGKRVQVTEG